MTDIWQVSEKGSVNCVQCDCRYVVVVNTFWKDNVIVRVGT